MPGTRYWLRVTCASTRSERGALSESVLADRPTVKKIVDRITASGKQSYVRKVLRSYDTCKTGFLSKDDLRSAMDRLALGLDDTEKNKVAACARVCMGVCVCVCVCARVGMCVRARVCACVYVRALVCAQHA